MSQAEDPAGGKRPKKKALGRGLAALLGDDELVPGRLPTEPRPGEKIIELPLESLEPNPFQPRRNWQPEALAALADSIREHGVLQPLLVRPAGQAYQIIAGERRFRACQMAGLTQVPVVVRQASDQQALLLALLENLQREDLGPLEQARAYQRLVDQFQLSQEQIAQGVGKDRSTVANTVRLLKLPRALQQDLASGRISAGHGRALLALPSEAAMRRVRDKVLKGELSVRATERLVKAVLNPPQAKPPDQTQVHLASLAQQMARQLGTKVSIKGKGKGGRVIIEYYSDRDLERLLAKLS